MDFSGDVFLHGGFQLVTFSWRWRADQDLWSQYDTEKAGDDFAASVGVGNQFTQRRLKYDLLQM